MLERPSHNIDTLVQPQQVYAQLGASQDGAVSARMQRGVDRAIALIAERSAVDAVVQMKPLTDGQPYPRLAGGPEIKSRRIGGALQGCSHAVVFVLTLGQPLDRLLSETMARQPHFGVMLDATASVAAEALVDELSRELQAGLPADYAVTPPFCPGYCDWPLAEQTVLFDALPEAPAGVQLSDDHLMQPQKSIAGVLGVGPRQAVAEHAIPCRRCAKPDCDHRRSPYRRQV